MFLNSFGITLKIIVFLLSLRYNIFCRCNVLSDPSLKLSIDWMVDNKTIDFDEEPRITKSDNSLRIINTTICDSGLYTCFASTELDEAKISATLIVRGKNLS